MRGGGQAEGALDVSVSREGQTEERAPGQSPATTQRHRLLVPRTTRHSWAPAQVSALQELRRENDKLCWNQLNEETVAGAGEPPRPEPPSVRSSRERPTLRSPATTADPRHFSPAWTFSWCLLRASLLFSRFPQLPALHTNRALLRQVSWCCSQLRAGEGVGGAGGGEEL